jgi:glycosyltransferase involved in cell wall biosynthesis
MRILHVIDSIDPATGGTAEALRQLCHIYRAGRYEIEVASLDAPETVDQYNFPATVHGLGPGKGMYGYAPRFVPWLREHLSSYDLVFLNSIWQYNVLAAYKLLANTRVPYGVFTHGMLDPYFKREFPLKHLKKTIYWHLFLKRILNEANAVLFTCEEEMILARQSFPGYKVRECILNFGIFAPDVDLANASAEFLARWPHLCGKRLAISMGRLHPKKGIDILIEAFAQSLAKHAEWELVIAGPDQVGMLADLKALAERIGVAERITWTGMISGALKWGAIASSEVFVLPSHQENFGIVVAEALACRVPVIISDKVNIWREIQSHQAGFICQDSIEGTRTALNRWAGLSAHEALKMRDGTLKCFDEHFNYDVIAGKVLEITESIAREIRR